MFAPAGFVPLTRVFTTLSEAALSAWAAEMHARYYTQSGFSGIDDDKTISELTHLKEILGAWLLARLLISYDVYAASPSGVVLLIDGWPLAHQEQIGWRRKFHWPDKDGYRGELKVSLQIMRDNRRCGPLSRFLFVDIHTGTLSVRRRMEWLEAEQERTGDNLLALAAALEPMDEWAVCLKGSDLPQATSDLLAHIGFDLPTVKMPDDPLDTARRGRPPKVPQIADAYSAKFPDGHGSLQREEVRRAIQPSVNFEFSLDSLDKAVRLVRDREP